MPPPEGIGDWANLRLFRDGHWDRINQNIVNDERLLNVFPPAEDRFRAFRIVPPDRVKVVVFGQDPYHQTLADRRPKADGLAFSIRGGDREREDALSKIFRSLNDHYELKRDDYDLTDWADAGVLLLNRFLTVPENRAEGHRKFWENGDYELYRDILSFLVEHDVSFGTILMGNQKFRKNARACVPPIHRRPVYECWHPVARKRVEDENHIYRVRPFQRINEWLRDQGDHQINWQGGQF